VSEASRQRPEVRFSPRDNKAAPPPAARHPGGNRQHVLKVWFHPAVGNTRPCQSVCFPQPPAPSASQYRTGLRAGGTSRWQEPLQPKADTHIAERGESRGIQPRPILSLRPPQRNCTWSTSHCTPGKRSQNNCCKLKPLVNLF